MDLMQRRRELMMAKKIRLPSEYQEVEYIVQMSANVYFITNYYPNNATRFFADASYRYNNVTLFDAGDLFRVYKDDAYYVYALAFGTSLKTTYGLNVFRQRTLQYTDDNKWYLKGINESNYRSWNYSSEAFQCQLPLIINGQRVDDEIVSNHSNPNPTVIYSLIIFENGVEVMHLVPCYRHSDNEVGLYDIVNNIFLTKSGTGTFSAGPNV